MTRLVTAGHGTLAEDEFAGLLRAAGVEVVVDVRSYPGSRRNPQFGRDAMARWLPARGLAYRWEPRLGGRRKPRPDSRHVALRHEAFRAYADHMGSDEFRDGLADLLAAAEAPSAVVCSESVWWRCHRRLLADAAVLLHDVEVVHLFHDGRLQPHPVTPEARVEDGEVVYDAGAPPLL